MFAFKRGLFHQRQAFASQRNFSTLVLSEQFAGRLSPTLGSVLQAAGQLNDG